MKKPVASRALWRSGLSLATLLASAAVANWIIAKKSERSNPPQGRFVTVDGVRLHYVVRGSGDTLVLLHGNGSMVPDFLSSGLVEEASKHFRVVVFDRPGFGHSNRPRDVVWKAEAQADLIHAALSKLGIGRALLVGHSWGTLVAAAMALRYPAKVKGLVLVSGYYFPTVRLDALMMSGPAVPILGDIARYTISPLLGWVLWPLLMRKIFGPQPVPSKFHCFPRTMALRPSQLRASAAESALMIEGASSLEGSYGALKMPLAIVAGTNDRLIDPVHQSERLHKMVPHSSFHRLAGHGHMLHQTATAELFSVIEQLAAEAA